MPATENDMTTTRHAELLALHYAIPLAAALLLAACATTHDPALCDIARKDIAAGESCLAEPTCAAKWDSPTFRMTIESARDDVRKYCAARS